MRIDTLKIQNYKCFAKEVFALNPQFTLVIGENGKGKTALLEAVSNLLPYGLSKLHSPLAFKQFFTWDVRTIAINGQPIKQSPLMIESDGIMFKEPISFVAFEQDDMVRYGEKKNGTITNQFIDKKKKERQNGLNPIFPVAAYYGTGRLWGKYEEELPYQQQEDGLKMAYEDCLVPNTTSKAFLAWYKTQEDEIRKFDRTDDKLMLQVINQAVTSMIPEWRDMAFSFRFNDLVGILDGEERYFRQLSDGYRNTIGMVADIIYRCIQLNPHLKERVLLETDGIVLIDELDLHLHPKWQLHIVADLKRIFPKIQFVATTHSPFIIQSVEADELLNLDKDDVPQLETDPINASIEEIVEKVMGVEQRRSQKFQEMQEAAKVYFELLKNKADKQRVEKAKLHLDRLRVLFNHDPAFVAQLESELPIM